MDIRSERISKAITESGYSYQELEKITGVSKSSLQRYATGETKKIPIDSIEAIATATGKDARFLMGRDDPLAERDESNISAIMTDNIFMIPLFDSVSAGFGTYADSQIVEYIPVYLENKATAKEYIAIRVKGDSMYPKIEDGDIVVVHKQDYIDNGDIGVVLIDGDDARVKKIEYDQNSVTLISVNPEYQDKTYTMTDAERVRVVGKVKKIIKEL